VIRALTRILAVCLLLAGHVPAIAFVRAALCEMACCRKAENASCHRPHSHSGPGLQSAPCVSACGGVTLGMTPGPVAAPAADGPPEPLFAGELAALPAAVPGARLLAVSLFQRPPPSSNLL
jgi:hypothetical protein